MNKHCRHLALVAVLAIHAISILAGCSSLPPQARKARSLLQQGAYREAEVAADQGLVEHPRLAALWQVKIQAAMGLGEADRAVSIYNDWYRARGSHDRTAIERMALTTLWQGLRVPSALVRTRAIQAIERREVEKLARDVVARMGDDDDMVAAAAAVALLRSHPGAPELATQLLRSDDPRARAIVVEGIGRKVGSRARGDLVPALADRAAEVRRAALDALAAMNDPDDSTRFMAVAQRDPDGDVRASAIRALAARPGAIAAARRALEDDHVPVRVAAVELLAAQDQTALLRTLVSTAGPMVAVRAAALAGAHDQASRAVLDQALKNPDGPIRAAAFAALPDFVDRRLMARPEALSRAAAGLDDTDLRVQVAAARALAVLGDTRGVTALAHLCSAPDPAIREAAVRGHQPSKQITLGLVATLADESAELRVLAAERLLELVD